MASILLVDDDDTLRNIICTVLNSMGHETLQAKDGKNAIALSEANNVDLVITDIVMPEKDGLELVTYFKKKEPPIKIIAMSGGGTLGCSSYLGIAKAMGASLTLSKPFRAEELKVAVKNTLHH